MAAKSSGLGGSGSSGSSGRLANGQRGRGGGDDGGGRSGGRWTGSSASDHAWAYIRKEKSATLSWGTRRGGFGGDGSGGGAGLAKDAEEELVPRDGKYSAA